MGILGFGKSAPIEEFAKQLTAALAQRYPVALEMDPTKKRNPMRLTKAFDSTFSRAIAFQQEYKLGIYGKAKLSAEFKDELKELGYPGDFVNLATSAMTKFLGNQR
jgi:hypothetical protein